MVFNSHNKYCTVTNPYRGLVVGSGDTCGNGRLGVQNPTVAPKDRERGALTGIAFCSDNPAFFILTRVWFGLAGRPCVDVVNQ